MNIEVLDSGHVTRDDAAYASLVGLDDGSIICGYSCGGGSSATGGTDGARSPDGGTTWTREGTILARTESPVTTNTLRLSRTPGGTLLAYGARRYDSGGSARFGRDPSEPVLCRSADGGKTWSEPAVLTAASSTGRARGFEVTCPILAWDEDRWLAPAGLLADAGSLGERVVVFSSADAGQTWPHSPTVFHDPDARRDAATAHGEVAHGAAGVDEFADFAFGLPSALPMGAGRLLAVHWCREAGRRGPDPEPPAPGGSYGVRWTRLQLSA